MHFSNFQASVVILNASMALMSTKSGFAQLEMARWLPAIDLCDVLDTRRPNPFHDEPTLDVSFAKAAVFFLSPGSKSVLHTK